MCNSHANRATIEVYWVNSLRPHTKLSSELLGASSAGKWQGHGCTRAHFFCCKTAQASSSPDCQVDLPVCPINGHCGHCGWVHCLPEDSVYCCCCSCLLSLCLTFAFLHFFFFIQSTCLFACLMLSGAAHRLLLSWRGKNEKLFGQAKVHTATLFLSLPLTSVETTTHTAQPSRACWYT